MSSPTSSSSNSLDRCRPNQLSWSSLYQGTSRGGSTFSPVSWFCCRRGHSWLADLVAGNRGILCLSAGSAVRPLIGAPGHPSKKTFAIGDDLSPFPIIASWACHFSDSHFPRLHLVYQELNGSDCQIPVDLPSTHLATRRFWLNDGVLSVSWRPYLPNRARASSGQTCQPRSLGAGYLSRVVATRRATVSRSSAVQCRTTGTRADSTLLHHIEDINWVSI